MRTSKAKKLAVQPIIEAVDLFCGIGGLSFGLKNSGIHVLAGYDLDSSCRYAFEANNGAVFHYKDIKKVMPEEILSAYSPNSIKLLAGCAPCQPFSSYAFKNKKKDPNKYDLLYEFGRLVKGVNPDIVTMENVAQILTFKEKPVLSDFVSLLEDEKYYVSVEKVFCPNYGIPQNRKRLVLLASKFGKINLISPTHTPGNYVTVEKTIGGLPKLNAGEVDKQDPLHRAKALSPLNMKRIQSTPYGGSWRDWPEDLLLQCHKSENGRSFGSVYGRMVWEKPAPTMTTQCTGLGNGRFGHPTQNRAISIREAALIQTFPKTYKFFPNEKEIAITKASRYIGNAVPPKLGEIIAESIICHLSSIRNITTKN
ncbi:DNA (cytosine-5-)-methyltransferase [Hoylesella saccharolytica F0055]|uniref:Cytosine-specific methyltransferase n=1 Tax=Hoylesella saccharolytica F0055 TaxID=1127699 RepID=L1NE41_9BACT|nr:DNA cytosine methyltransferase [Hoylesella saccharolytica]EKY01606.1 DNA (cytosine-5-)-methyltransferase [Hoylesella saccharolytica F0055]